MRRLSIMDRQATRAEKPNPAMFLTELILGMEGRRHAFCCVRQVKGENNDVMVKRLPKKPAPKRFGRKLTASQKELATHICVDCGWIYAERSVLPSARCKCNRVH